MQTLLQVLYDGMSAKQPLADRGNISRQMVCRDVLALMDHVSLLNGSQPVKEMPMSLLECTTWTLPNVWLRTAYCSATFSATLSSLTSVVPTQTKARPLQTCQAASGPYTLLRRSHARHCCLPVELSYSSVFFRDLSFQVEKWVQSKFTSCRCLPQQK